MRINTFIASATGMSRRAADKVIEAGQVKINGQPAKLGDQVAETDTVTYKGEALELSAQTQIILINKPVGYVCSRDGQGSQTVYDLLPPELHHLKLVGRLDKDSSGLILLTNDGQLANKLTHPSFAKEKIYQVEINNSLKPEDFDKITQSGVNIGEKNPSKFQLQQLEISNEQLTSKLVPNSYFLVTLTEGKNRQIRRTFEALGYKVIKLHRTNFGDYDLADLESGKYQVIKS